MAEMLPAAIEQELLGIKHLVWGNEFKPDIFKRWSQGFRFSESEPSALEQLSGGPCAVLAPVQAFILKNLLIEYRDLSFREKIQSDIISKLIDALIEILDQCKTTKYYLVYLKHQYTNITSEVSEVNCDTPQNRSENQYSYQNITTLHEFHERLQVAVFERMDDVKRYFHENIDSIKSQYGVLLFLYSVIYTKGLELVTNDTESNVPLIDETHGYGSQSLINLMLTGRATTYVWDHEQNVGGLTLKGISEQSPIGFITLMEHLRYCTVGSFYKNPKNPVWVIGSDTHLTVLFSNEFKLVSPETKSEEARRVFKNNDPDGNNFINSQLLGNVLEALGLCSDKEYVEIMKRKLDSENLGIILLNAFMEEFFPKEESSTPDIFELIHYNGLASSNINGSVQYSLGSAILLEGDIKSTCDSNPILTALQTKWPNIDVSWKNVMPSLN